MLSGKGLKSKGGKKFTMAEASPKKMRSIIGHHKDTQAARNSGTGGDNAMNIVPGFEELARQQAAQASSGESE